MSKARPATHIARKIDWAIQDRRSTVRAMIAATKVRSPSAVSEWKRTGRIAKQHIPTLAALTGTTERWWLTPDAPVPPTQEWLAEGPAVAPTSEAATPVQDALATLEPLLLAVGDEARRAVGMLLGRWAEDPRGKRENVAIIATLLAPHVPNDHVEGAFGSVVLPAVVPTDRPGRKRRD